MSPWTATVDRPVRPGPGERRPWTPPRVEEARGPAGHLLRWCDLPNQPVAHLVAHLAVPGSVEPADLEGITTVYAQASILSAPGLDRVAFAEALGACGARLDTRVSDDGIDVWLSVPEWNLDRLVPLLADVLASPALGDDEIDQALEQVRGQLLQELGDPGSAVGLGLRRAYYEPDDRRSRPGEGSPESLGRITPDQVRRFGDDQVRAADVTVVLAGRLDGRDPEQLLSRVVAGRPATPTVRPPAARPPRRRPGRVVMPWDGVPQTQVALAWAAPEPASPRRAAVAVLAHHLGGDFTSVVNTVMRAQHGFTYGMHAHLAGRGTGSQLLLGGSVEADSTPQAVKVLDDLLDGVVAQGLSDDTVSEVSEALRGKAPARWADAGSAAVTLLDNALADLPTDQEARWLDELSRVDPQDVRRAVDDVLGGPRATSLCGPADRIPSVEGDE